MDAPLDYYERLLSDETEAAIKAQTDRLDKIVADHEREREFQRRVFDGLRGMFPNA